MMIEIILICLAVVLLRHKPVTKKGSLNYVSPLDIKKNTL